jgi:hypothetical protein
VLASRSLREETSEAAASRTVRSDKLRFEMLTRHTIQYKIRAEIKSVLSSESSDHALGTLLFVQAGSSVKFIRYVARVTFFNFESTDAAMNVYENNVYGAYPLVALSGTGRRIAVLISPDFYKAHLSLKIAATSTSAGEQFDGGVELSFLW